MLPSLCSYNLKLLKKVFFVQISISEDKKLEGGGAITEGQVVPTLSKMSILAGICQTWKKLQVVQAVQAALADILL